MRLQAGSTVLSLILTNSGGTVNALTQIKEKFLNEIYCNYEQVAMRKATGKFPAAFVNSWLRR